MPSLTSRSAALALLPTLLIGCAQAGAGEPSAPIGDRPSFILRVEGGPAAGSYASDPAATLGSCSHAADGSWRYLYAGGRPWVSLDLLIGAQASKPEHASDVALEISAGSGYLWIDQGGFRGGDAPGRSEVAVAIRTGSDAVTFDVEATTPNRTPTGDGPPSTLTLAVTCPA